MYRDRAVLCFVFPQWAMGRGRTWTVGHGQWTVDIEVHFVMVLDIGGYEPEGWMDE